MNASLSLSLSGSGGRGFVESCAPLRLQHPFVSDLSSSRRRRRCGETGVNPRTYPVLVIALPSETVQEHFAASLVEFSSFNATEVPADSDEIGSFSGASALRLGSAQLIFLHSAGEDSDSEL